MLLGKIEISKERGLLCVSREGETLFGAYFISRILSFPAYARDATCSSARIFAKMIFHFPLMREMQPRKCDASHAQSPFISRLCARCNLAEPDYIKIYTLSFPAYARDATKWPGITRNSVNFHFPLMREMQPSSSP